MGGVGTMGNVRASGSPTAVREATYQSGEVLPEYSSDQSLIYGHLMRGLMRELGWSPSV